MFVAIIFLTISLYLHCTVMIFDLKCVQQITSCILRNMVTGRLENNLYLRVESNGGCLGVVLRCQRRRVLVFHLLVWTMSTTSVVDWRWHQQKTCFVLEMSSFIYGAASATSLNQSRTRCTRGHFYQRSFRRVQRRPNIIGDGRLSSYIVPMIIQNTLSRTSVSRFFLIRILLQRLAKCRCSRIARQLKYRRGVPLCFLHVFCTWLVGFKMMLTAGCGHQRILVLRHHVHVFCYGMRTDTSAAGSFLQSCVK